MKRLWKATKVGVIWRRWHLISAHTHNKNVSRLGLRAVCGDSVLNPGSEGMQHTLCPCFSCTALLTPLKFGPILGIDVTPVLGEQFEMSRTKAVTAVGHVQCVWACATNPGLGY